MCLSAKGRTQGFPHEGWLVPPFCVAGIRGASWTHGVDVLQRVENDAPRAAPVAVVREAPLEIRLQHLLHFGPDVAWLLVVHRLQLEHYPVTFV